MLYSTTSFAAAAVIKWPPCCSFVMVQLCTYVSFTFHKIICLYLHQREELEKFPTFENSTYHNI